MRDEAAELMILVREKRPLIHHITNYVTVKDCADATICAGGSPVMAHHLKDAEEMAAHASALLLNIGTPSDDIEKAMIAAGKVANKKGIPVILDPVGVGATRYRTKMAMNILDNVKVSIIKGNAGEIGTLAGIEGGMRGVDSIGIGGSSVDACVTLSKRTGATVAVTGVVDVVSDGERTAVINNGHTVMSIVSGTGCMAGSVIACYASCTDDMLLASAAALAVFGIAGNKAAKRTKGLGSFMASLKEDLSLMTQNEAVPLANIRLL